MVHYVRGIDKSQAVKSYYRAQQLGLDSLDSHEFIYKYQDKIREWCKENYSHMAVDSIALDLYSDPPVMIIKFEGDDIYEIDINCELKSFVGIVRMIHCYNFEKCSKEKYEQKNLNDHLEEKLGKQETNRFLSIIKRWGFIK